MIILTLSLVMSTLSIAKTLTPISAQSYKYQDAPEYQAILLNLKTFGTFSLNNSEPEESKTVVKSLSRGEQMVEAAKARNRAILAERNKQEVDSNRLGALPSKDGHLQEWKSEEKRTLNEWKKHTQDQLISWKKEQEIFLGRLQVYKKNMFEIPIKVEKIAEIKISKESVPNVHIVNGAFKVPIRDQFYRPTCVAFAGVRAIETILAQHDQAYDLSEQYLYWASKPKCQTAPCAEKGSWITPAYRYSQNHVAIDIPLENDCSYKMDTLPSNETQIPLGESCKQGSVKVSNFMEVRTISEVIELIKKDTPVVVAAKLSENFYKNKGLISLSDSRSTGLKLDAHAMGHAFLAIGLMELPDNLKSVEGQFCIVVANSWGKGWGVGGYSCMTEKWFEKFRQPSAFVAPVKITIR